ncbi:hypothetical protein ACFR9U_12095 [Halorientalis brevis]|uniref:Uncharacterized protein n=1 Tax=Halorientalis brevis TaxID=1126241 RepID=A0ABD6CET6_9EURY|nr:hypothetical protein [Halorientalis brevis]
MQLPALLVPLGVTGFLLLAVCAWVFPRGTAGVVLTLTAAAVAIAATLELKAAGLPEAYAYVIGFALAQPLLVILMTLPERFDARAYWRPERLPTIALDVALAVAVGTAVGALAVFSLASLDLLAGDRGTASLSAVALGSLFTFLARTRRFRGDGDAQPALTTAILDASRE